MTSKIIQYNETLCFIWYKFFKPYGQGNKESELIEHMDAMSFDDDDDDDEDSNFGAVGKAVAKEVSLSHRSAFCGMCRLIMLKANNNNNKSNKWLKTATTATTTTTVYVGMVIDTA